MTVNTQKTVRVLAAPTGPTGTMKQVRIIAAFAGATGQFPQWKQINAGQLGPTGTFETVAQVTGATGPAHDIKTVIIPGFTGPA